MTRNSRSRTKLWGKILPFYVVALGFRDICIVRRGVKGPT